MQTKYTDQKYDDTNRKTTNICKIQLEELTEKINQVSQHNGMYNANKIIGNLSAALNMSNADKTITYIRLMCAKLCHRFKIESAIVENLCKYLSTLNLDINDPNLDWNAILFEKHHPSRPALKLSRRPRTATFLHKKESAVFIQCLVWLKLTKPVVEKFNFNVTPGQIQSYWADHYDDLIEFNPKIISMDSPWKNKKHCSYAEFTDYIKYRYDGLCPSEPWFYKKLSGDLRNRKFSVADFDFIIKEIHESKRLSKKYKLLPFDIDTFGGLKSN